MHSVDEQLRDFYSRQRLPEAKAQEILQLAQGRRRVKRRKHLALAAALLLTALSAWWLGRTAGQRQLASQAVAEVTKNHLKDYDAEVQVSRYEELGPALPDLPFTVAAPEGLDGYRLVGGRYCSLQTRLAAQLELQPTGPGAEATLYVVSKDAELETLDGVSRILKDVRVTIWVQEDLLFALAEPQPRRSAR